MLPPVNPPHHDPQRHRATIPLSHHPTISPSHHPTIPPSHPTTTITITTTTITTTNHPALYRPLPRSTDEYLHLAGRTGRCGAAGDAVSIVTYREADALKGWANQLGFKLTKESEFESY